MFSNGKEKWQKGGMANGNGSKGRESARWISLMAGLRPAILVALARVRAAFRCFLCAISVDAEHRH